ncbi:SDR family oxidoreductase [Ruegeria arenilitoris]|uniref:SDR family oxidoreductase n=1 Tax=Ruegeria arenilitoris TaxID=1173585 RepID=UPI00147F4CC2|nr:SDR family oxidoreductase [Ruegeria arenilitoris]
MNRIDGKIALITGGTQGLGAAIARVFAQAGAAGVAIVGRGAAKGEAKAAEISVATGVPVEMIAADLGNVEDVQRIVPAAVARFGTIDILVNAAGLTDRGNLLNTTPELFDQMFAVNARAPFFLMQDTVKQLEKDGKGGRIVNIGSTSSHAGQPFIAPYCASKAALSTLTRSSGYALMRNGIHVNQLDIGWMASDHERQLQLEESGDPDWEEKANAGLPFGRLLDPQEVARAVLFLASDDAGMMTGAVIHYDQSVWGGYDAQAPGPAERLKE